jgi:DNA-binding XRE family transcriptional regulator
MIVFPLALGCSSKALDLTQADLAKQIGCPAVTIKKIE